MSHEGRVLDTVNGVSVVDCQLCKFAHIVPLPSEQHLAELYAERYYTELKPDYIENAEADADWWRMVYHERLDLFERWLRNQPAHEPLHGGGTARGPVNMDDRQFTLLDVGSGPGGFLLAAHERGWDAVGLEPSKTAFDYSTALGLVVYNIPFDAAAVETWNGFDVVNLGEVLEHVPKPAVTLKLAYQALSPGGFIHVIVPNDYSLLQRAMRATGDSKGDPHWIVPDQHMNYFTERSLCALLRRSGFHVGDVTATFPLELFVLMGLNYLGNPTVGRQIHAMRKRLELSLEQAGLGDAKRDLYRALGRRGIGRDIVMLARKPMVADDDRE